MKIPDKANVTFCGHDLGEVDMSDLSFTLCPKPLYDMITAEEQKDDEGNPYKIYMGTRFTYGVLPSNQQWGSEFLKQMAQELGIEYKRINLE